MKRQIAKVAMATMLVTSGAVHAQANIESNLDASIRLGLELVTEPEAELVWGDYESQIRWTGGASLNEGLNAVSYIELGFDQDAGVNTTREAWVGIEGDFGTVSGGKQYAAFYDAVSSFVDVDFLDGCGLSSACERESSVLKYTSAGDSDLQFVASARMERTSTVPATVINAGSPLTVDFPVNDEFIDGLDVGAILQSGDLKLGVAATVEIQDSTGFGIGIGAELPLDQATVSANFLFADEDIVGGTDDAIELNAAYKQDQIYAIATILNRADTGFGIQGGYTMPIVEDVAFMFFEAGILDSGTEGSDTELFGRAVFVYNFDLFTAAN